MTAYTEMNMLRRNTVGDVLRRNSQRHPNKKGLVLPSTAEYAWSKFNSSINRIANGLKALDINKGDKVGIFSRNTFQFAVLMYATGKIGATISPVSADLRNDDFTFIVKHSEIKMLFVEDSLIHVVNQNLTKIPDIKLGYIKYSNKQQKPDGWVDFDELINNHPNTEPEFDVGAEDVASLSYTSGTESLPKAVMLTHGNLTNYMTTFFQWGILPTDICLHVLPLFYTGGLGTFSASLLMGQTVVLPYSPDPVEIVKSIKKYNITFMVLPPTLWVRLLQVPGIEEAAKSMRIGVTFGSTIPESMVTGWNKIAPQMTWVSFYGQSETSCSGTVARFNSLDEICEGDLGWVGKPVHDLEVRIVDENDQDVAVGEVGEILFRGPAVFKGYFKDEEKTAEVFSGGWLHTGDLGRMNEDGELFFVDRKKDMVKSGGENIATASVEYAVSSHPKVEEVVAFGVPHPEWMEALTVAVIPKQGKKLKKDEITLHCRQVLPRFKVPKHVIIVNDFPRNTSGKVLKRELRSQYQDLATQGISDREN